MTDPTARIIKQHRRLAINAAKLIERGKFRKLTFGEVASLLAFTTVFKESLEILMGHKNEKN